MHVCVQVDVEELRQQCFPFWVAPELLQGDPPSAASDVYALGMLLYEMLYRNEPFAGEDPEVLFQRGPSRLQTLNEVSISSLLSHGACAWHAPHHL